MIDKTKSGYGKFYDENGHSIGKKGVDIIDDRNYRHYKVCIEALDAETCKKMYPHKERPEKKEKFCE